MQGAETVLGVLPERGRRGLPCDELYRQLFNPQLYLWLRASVPRRRGDDAGADGETVDGMSLAKIERIIGALRREAPGDARTGHRTFERVTGRPPRSVSNGRRLPDLSCIHTATAASAIGGRGRCPPPNVTFHPAVSSLR